MNIEIKDEYLEKGFTGNELILYAYIAKRMQEDGGCNDTMEEISNNTNISYRTLCRIMKNFRKKGYIVKKSIYEIK